MSKNTPKITPADAARQWSEKHAGEGLDLGTLEAALATVDKLTVDAHHLASQLGAVLENRKAAVKVLKETLKAAKAARKNPTASDAPKKVPAKKAPAKKTAAKKPAVQTATPGA